MTASPVFIFSLPRSGSTLLQRLLATSPEVHTVPETWLLLAPFYPMMRSGVLSVAGHSGTVDAVGDFVGSLPGEEEDYYAAVREFALSLYSASAGQKKYFLDKTPRYHLVVEHIIKAFPDAKFIFLWRNPMAVIASMVETWGPAWCVHRYHIDLYTGLENLVAAYEDNRSRSLAINYEDLTIDPSQTLDSVSDYLDLTDQRPSVDLGRDTMVQGRMGDQIGSKRYGSVVTETHDKWQDVIDSHIRKNWCKRYLDWIGAERLSIMGYELDGLLSQLDEIRPDILSTVRDIPVSVYGRIYAPLETNILRNNLARLRRGERLYAHT